MINCDALSSNFRNSKQLISTSVNRTVRIPQEQNLQEGAGTLTSQENAHSLSTFVASLPMPAPIRVSLPIPVISGDVDDGELRVVSPPPPFDHSRMVRYLNDCLFRPFEPPDSSVYAFSDGYPDGDFADEESSIQEKTNNCEFQSDSDVVLTTSCLPVLDQARAVALSAEERHESANADNVANSAAIDLPSLRPQVIRVRLPVNVPVLPEVCCIPTEVLVDLNELDTTCLVTSDSSGGLLATHVHDNTNLLVNLSEDSGYGPSQPKMSDQRFPENSYVNELTALLDTSFISNKQHSPVSIREDTIADLKAVFDVAQVHLPALTTASTLPSIASIGQPLSPVLIEKIQLPPILNQPSSSSTVQIDVFEKFRGIHCVLLQEETDSAASTSVDSNDATKGSVSVVQSVIPSTNLPAAIAIATGCVTSEDCMLSSTFELQAKAATSDVHHSSLFDSFTGESVVLLEGLPSYMNEAILLKYLSVYLSAIVVLDLLVLGGSDQAWAKAKLKLSSIVDCAKVVEYFNFKVLNDPKTDWDEDCHASDVSVAVKKKETKHKL